MLMILFALLLGAFGAFLTAVYGRQWGFDDWPGERSSHHRVTPKGGGVGILAAFCLSAVWIRLPAWFWLPAGFLSLISLLGDRFELSVRLRLGIQGIVAVMACTGLAVGRTGLAGWWVLGLPLGLVVAVFCVVATANIYNFMDGINGIAGLTAIMAFGLLAGIGWIRGEPMTLVQLEMAIAAASAGFLPWNFPRARVFMGDVGSILLGFVFALLVTVQTKSLSDFLLYFSILLPFYTDEGLTILARLGSGDSLLQPHRRHVYQILVNQLGYPHWKISSLYVSIQLGVAGTAFWAAQGGLFVQSCWFLFNLAFLAAAGLHLRRFERSRPDKNETV